VGEYFQCISTYLVYYMKILKESEMYEKRI
jgi:hypothetical protein